MVRNTATTTTTCRGARRHLCGTIKMKTRGLQQQYTTPNRHSLSHTQTLFFFFLCSRNRSLSLTRTTLTHTSTIYMRETARFFYSTKTKKTSDYGHSIYSRDSRDKGATTDNYTLYNRLWYKKGLQKMRARSEEWCVRTGKLTLHSTTLADDVMMMIAGQTDLCRRVFLQQAKTHRIDEQTHLYGVMIMMTMNRPSSKMAPPTTFSSKQSSAFIYTTHLPCMQYTTYIQTDDTSQKNHICVCTLVFGDDETTTDCHHFYPA